MEPVNARPRDPIHAAFLSGLTSRVAREWVIFVLVLALLGGGIFNNWRRDLAQWEAISVERLERDANVAGALLVGQLDSIKSALDGLREHRFWPRGFGVSPNDIGARLSALASAMDGIQSLFVTDQRGVVVASSRQNMLGVDWSTTECFQSLRDSVDSARYCLSSPFVSETDRRTYVVSAMATNAEGRFDGTVTASVDPGWVVRLLRPLQERDDDLRLTLMHAKGTVIHSEPASGPWSGGPTPVPISWRSKVEAPAVTHAFVGPDSDGRERMVVASPVSLNGKHSLMVLASRDRAKLNAAVATNSAELALGAGGLAGIGSLMLLLYQRRRAAFMAESARETANMRVANARLADLIEQQVAIQTISAFAHDLNQPLLAISAYSEAALRTLRRGVTDAGKLSRMIEGSHIQALRAGAMMHQMSAQLARALEARVDNEPFDVNAVITEVVKHFCQQQVGVAVPALCLRPDTPLVAGSRARTSRILENLLVNAHQVSQKAGTTNPAMPVVISSRSVDGYAEVSVRDFGPGVPAGQAERIFSPFFTTKEFGLGLGLSISRALAESQGGRLELGPDPGDGAEFLLTIPIAKAHEQHLSR